MNDDFPSVEITLKNYRCFSDSSPAKFTLNSGFTAFVGINNTGKSTILKFFYEFRSFFELFKELNSNYYNANNHQVSRNLPIEVGDFNQIFSNSNNRDLIIELGFKPTKINIDNSGIRYVKIFRITIRRQQEPERIRISGNNSFRVQGFVEMILDDDSLLTDGNRQSNLMLYTQQGKQINLEPIVKTLNSFSNTLYIGPFRNAINIGANESYYDIQVGQAMIKQWKEWKSGDSVRANEFATTITENIRDVFGFSQLEINPSSNEQTLQINIDRKSYKLSEIGSGLAQFFMVLANAANKQPSFVLIDEPELNLHPSLQLDFLTTIASFSKDGVVFCTHNYGLARAIAQQIYLVQRTTRGNNISTSNKIRSLSEFLGELGFNAYYDLGFDKVLLVEGPTDLITIQQFLKFYQKEHKILLIHLGGRSSINGNSEPMLEEIKRITNNVNAIIDSEKPSATSPLPQERQAFKESCIKAGINLCILERRAMENYFTEEPIKGLNDSYRALTPYQLLSDVKPHWGKADNWRIAREMKKEDLEGTDLGKFLEQL